MGIKELLLTPINFGSADKYRWNEPMLCRIRLRRDIWLRLLIAASMWAGGTGIMLLMFSVNNNPPGIGTAIFLGAAFALGPTLGAMFWRRKLTSGRIFLSPCELQRTSTSWGLAWIQTNFWKWPLSEISRCILVPAESLGQSFSVLIVESDGKQEIIGLPAGADRDRIRGVLLESGVPLAKAADLPAEWTRAMSLPIALAVSAIGILPLILGGMMYGVAGKTGLPQRDNIARQHQPFQQATPAIPGLPQNEPASSSAFDNDAAEQSAIPAFGGAAPGVIPGLNRAGEPPNPATIGRPSELVGGKGGSPFLKYDSRHRAIKGVGYHLGTWDGRERVALITPFFDDHNEGRPDTLFADKGYAIGAIRVDANDLVNAVQLIYMKDNGNGTLDPSDSYDSEWIGIPSGTEPKVLSGNGDYVTGFHGRGAAVLDAIGIVVRP